MPVFINPVSELGGLLLEVEKPGRYVGGEFGILAKNDREFRTLIAFPDLYEIGMGNQALRIIYNRMNGMPDIVCDRAFAPAPDFEKLLRENNIPLYGLDTGIRLADTDLLMFTLGYELGLNGILTMLDVSRIPLRCGERGQEHPVVIAGGPAVSNPLPYSPFIDAFWLGEAEAGFFELAAELAHLKKSGKGRAVLLETISAHPNVWVKGKKKARRAVAAGIDLTEADVFPVPSMKIVQHHGTVEIMRGCPNGCRFCHAGFWYRPMRQKSLRQICEHAKAMVTLGGWREISLSSLSSGDYCGVEELVETLNQMFYGRHISFQMPSLKVSTFSLGLLEKISETRKSGLTFAVETPQDEWQFSINKEVTKKSVVTILDEAKKRGWRTAKFYFMIGLPPSLESEKKEEEEIVNFIIEIARLTRMHFSINVGIFVPKPHTPYQGAAQIDSDTAVKKLDFIRMKLKPLGHRVSVSDPLISRIEGLLSKGDERAGLLCEEAYRGGSRLDAWSEYINKRKWLELLERSGDLTSGCGYTSVDSCVSPDYLQKEREKSEHAQITPPCEQNCSDLCGVCTKKTGIIYNPDFYVNHENIQVNDTIVSGKIINSDPAVYRMLFSFSKRKSAVFHGHLSLIEIFSMAFIRAKLPVMYTQGFNPLAKIEFAAPLAVGITADGEMAAADFATEISVNLFIESLNANLPEGIRIEEAGCFCIPAGMKKHSLSSLLWGFAYENAGENKTDYVHAAADKSYKQSRCGDYTKHKSALFSLVRRSVLAKDQDGNNEWASYFDVYRTIYSGRQNMHYD
jgi:radical SAM-linked protein